MKIQVGFKMFDELIADFTSKVKEYINELTEELSSDLNFMKFERKLRDFLNELTAGIMQKALNDLLAQEEFLKDLKEVGARKGMRFKGYKTINIYLTDGQVVKIRTPYFSKALPKDKKRRRKRGPNGSGSHLGLECLGFIGRASPQLVSEVAKLSLLCPSFEVAQKVLAGRGIIIGIKVIRRLSVRLAQAGLQSRGEVSLEEGLSANGLTVVIGVDGGRLRIRGNDKEKKADQKRKGYETDWKEPKLFAIYLIDEDGRRVREFEYLYDATMGDCHQLFSLLETYLKALGISNISKVVFCGDGAEWIWKGTQKLIDKLGIERSVQVLDYTHAVQNLQKIIDLLPEYAPKAEIVKEWHAKLWEGDIDALHKLILVHLSGTEKEQALKKWSNYFKRNEERMQYKKFKAMNLPCGSGFVESAIRRVINMRLKSAGSFWKPDMAEYMLFLRSQFLSGRWTILLNNITSRTRKLLPYSYIHNNTTSIS